MSKVNPFVSLFVAMVGALAAFFVPVVMLLTAHGERLARIEAVQSEHGERMTRLEDGQTTLRADIAAANERLTRIEAGQTEHGERLARIEDGQNALRGDMAATNERMARVEGTVAGVLGRPWPERLAQAPEPETGAGG